MDNTKKKAHGSRPTILQVDRAFLALDRGVHKLGQWAQENKSYLEFSVVKDIVKILKQKGRLAKDLDPWVDLLEAGKNFLMGETNSRVEAHEWVVFLKTSSGLLELYSRYENFVMGQDIVRGEGFEQFNEVVKGADQMLFEALLRRKDPIITNEEAYKLIGVMELAGFFPMGFITADLARSSWDLLVSKVLKPSDDDSILLVVKGLHTSHLEVLREEFQDWSRTQDLINQGKTNWSLNCEDLLSQESGGLSEVKRFVSCSPWPLRKDSRGHLVLSQSLLTSKWTDKDISSFNWKRAVVRQLVRVYSDTPEDIYSGLTEEQLSWAYMDLKPFLVVLGLVDEKDSDFYENLFMESNLFTPLADGNWRVSQAEGVAYFHYVLTGLERTHFAISKMSHCLVEPEIADQFHSDCYWAALREQFLDIFQSMPELNRYVEGLEDKVWIDSTQSLEIAVRKLGQNPAIILKSHIVKIFVLLGYLETMMLRYDRDLNQKINFSEVQKSVPLFTFTFQSKLPDLFASPEDISTFLTFLVRYGVLPGMGDPLLDLKFKHWKELPEKRHLTAERADLARVVGILKSSLNLLLR